MALANLKPEGQSLQALPGFHRQGLIGITILALLSFITSTLLFLYLSYKFIAWYRLPDERPVGHQTIQNPHQRQTDFTLGIDGVFTEQPAPQEPPVTKNLVHVQRAKCAPNQFLVLIFNLLLADMHQATAFLLNATWLQYNGIWIDMPVCFAQGLFVSLGDLSSSMFITAIAIHSYLAVVHDYRPPHSVLYMAICAAWVFVYAISIIPIVATSNGAEVGGFFVRAGAWCWMNRDYEVLRLVTHYLYIFMGLGTTSALYTAIYVSLRRQEAASRANGAGKGNEPISLKHNPLFLIYPVIYVVCTLPLAAGRIASMAGANVPVEYFCFAGAMIASNGFWDCLLFGTTRHVIIFSSKYDVDTSEDGLQTFNFMSSSLHRGLGHMVSIQGGNNDPKDQTAGGWWTWSQLSGKSMGNKHWAHERTTSQESLRGPAIQLDTVTTVVVEVDSDKERDIRYPDPDALRSGSVNSSERELVRRN